MARTIRTVAQIQQQILDAKAAQPALSGLTSTSSTAIYRLWAYVTAVGINLFEQLLNIFQSDIETKIAAAAPGSLAWMKQKTLEFQYSATNPQATQLINLVPTYPVIDPTLRIITRASVKQKVAGGIPTIYQVDVKVAKSEPPTPLTTTELNALEAYYSQGGSSAGNGNGIAFAGVNYNFISVDPDQMYLKANVIYNGQYAGTVQTDTINAINQYLKDLSSAANFDGVFEIIRLTDYIQQVPGVKDFTIEYLRIRTYLESFPTGTTLVSSYTLSTPSYNPLAGYIVAETTGGSQLSNTLSFFVG